MFTHPCEKYMSTETQNKIEELMGTDTVAETIPVTTAVDGPIYSESSEPPVEAASGDLGGHSPVGDLTMTSNSGTQVSAPAGLTAKTMQDIMQRFPQLKDRMQRELKKARKAARPAWRKS